DTATNTVETAITVGQEPFGVAVTPDGKTAYVTNVGSGPVTPIDTATNTAGTAITVGSLPVGIAMRPLPEVLGVSPGSGPASGGTSVTITGTGFLAGVTVEIGRG